MIPENEKQSLFLQLIFQHQQLAMMGMGQMENPMSNAKEVNLEYAKVAIDTIEVLKEKTKGNLSEYEEKFLESILSQVQVKFVEVSNNAPKS